MLNLNPTDASVGVRHRVSIHYAKQAELAKPMQPLFTKGVYGLQLLEGQDGYFGVESPKQEHARPGLPAGAERHHARLQPTRRAGSSPATGW